MAAYARVYMHAAQVRFGNRLLQLTDAKWPDLKQGFKDAAAHSFG
jgi:hypothetical protein